MIKDFLDDNDLIEYNNWGGACEINYIPSNSIFWGAWTLYFYDEMEADVETGKSFAYFLSYSQRTTQGEDDRGVDRRYYYNY